MKPWIGLAFFCAAISSQQFADPVQAQGFGRGPGFRGGRGMGAVEGARPGMRSGEAGAMADSRHDADRDVFHFLLANHQKIQRTVKELPNGVETLTESKDPDVAAKIKEHVGWMQHRVENGSPIRMRDPLFAEIFRNADKIKMSHADTANGVKVIETSDDPRVAKLIQAHAKVVSAFVQNGFAEARRNHSLPSDDRSR